MRCLTLSGWGQAFDVLQGIWPEALAYDYASRSHAQDALEDIGRIGEAAELVVGWSLGGQLAVRAIAAGLMKPKALVLIATPFQFVAEPERTLGMPKDVFDSFRANYAADPQRTLGKAWSSIIRGDQHADAVRPHLEAQDRQSLAGKYWLEWLDHLQAFSCADLHLEDERVCLHGR